MVYDREEKHAFWFRPRLGHFVLFDKKIKESEFFSQFIGFTRDNATLFANTTVSTDMCKKACDELDYLMQGDDCQEIKKVSCFVETQLKKVQGMMSFRDGWTFNINTLTAVPTTVDNAYFKLPVNTAYPGIDKENKKLKQFISSVLPKRNERDFVMYLFARAIFGECPKAFVQLLGEMSHNGKTTLLALLRTAFPSLITTFTFDALFSSNKSQKFALQFISELKFNRVVLEDEVNDGSKDPGRKRLADATLIKKLTKGGAGSGEKVAATTSGHKQVFVPITWMMVLGVNHSIEVQNCDAGIRERATTVKMRTRFVDDDPAAWQDKKPLRKGFQYRTKCTQVVDELTNSPEDLATGFFYLFVDAYRRKPAMPKSISILKEKLFPDCSTTGAESAGIAKPASDAEKKWFEVRVQRADATAWCSSKDLLEDYARFYQLHEPPKPKMFANIMKRLMPGQLSVKGGGGGTMGWKGICFVEPAEGAAAAGLGSR